MMDIATGDISALVFKRIPKKDMAEFSLTGQMLTLLMHFDGKKDMRSIARITEMDIGTMRAAISKLLALELIAPVEGAISMLNADFLIYLKNQLSLATGPIAEVLIEDAVQDLGVDPTRIPRYRAAELTDILSRLIPREEKKIEFQQAMIKKIKESEGEI